MQENINDSQSETSEKTHKFNENAKQNSLNQMNDDSKKAIPSHNVRSPELLAFNSAKVLADLIVKKTSFDFSSGHATAKSSDEEKKELIVALHQAGVDPLVFDAMLSEEIDRRLKQRFGYAFLALTFLFTAASYAIICLNAIYKWSVPDNAIIALIIETPIQFIGLLYIIARNLFPQSEFRNRIELINKNRSVKK